MKKKRIYSVDISPDKKEEVYSLFEDDFKEADLNKNKFNLVLENNDQPYILYHYTTFSTFKKIIEGMKNEENNNYSNSLILRATKIDQLNDLKEFKLATELLANLIKQHENSLNDRESKHIANKLNKDKWKDIATFCGLKTLPFITSFSSNPDNLPMWQNYGDKGQGIALGIKKMKINDIWDKSNKDKPIWVKCIYDESPLRKKFKKAVEEYLYDIINFEGGGLKFKGFPNITLLSAKFSELKHIAFDYEQEWRLVKICSKSEAEKKKKYYKSRSYIEHRLPKNILKEIIIGPTANKNVTKKGVKNILKDVGYNVEEDKANNGNFVSVKCSGIPYRLYK